MGEPLFRGVVVSLGSNIRNSKLAKCQDLFEYSVMLCIKTVYRESTLLAVVVTCWPIILWRKEITSQVSLLADFARRSVNNGTCPKISIGKQRYFPSSLHLKGLVNMKIEKFSGVSFKESGIKLDKEDKKECSKTVQSHHRKYKSNRVQELMYNSLGSLQCRTKSTDHLDVYNIAWLRRDASRIAFAVSDASIPCTCDSWRRNLDQYFHSGTYSCKFEPVATPWVLIPMKKWLNVISLPRDYISTSVYAYRSTNDALGKASFVCILVRIANS